MKFILISCLLGVFVAGTYAKSPAKFSKTDKTLVIKIFNTEEQPADDAKILAAVNEVRNDFLLRANRKVVIKTPVVVYKGSIELDGETAFWKKQTSRRTLAIVFTNQKRYGSAGVMAQESTLKNEGMDGYAYTLLHVVYVYRADAQYDQKDRSGHNYLVSTIEHEIGHLFGLDHSSDPRSLMYDNGGGYGLWTGDVVRAMQKRRLVRRL